MIYVDQLFRMQSQEAEARRVGARHDHQWCHLWGDDIEELHRFAARLGMHREWFQDKKGFPHYDLVPSRRARAVALGAKEVSLREFFLATRKAAHAKREAAGG